MQPTGGAIAAERLFPGYSEPNSHATGIDFDILSVLKNKDSRNLTVSDYWFTDNPYSKMVSQSTLEGFVSPVVHPISEIVSVCPTVLERLKIFCLSVLGALRFYLSKHSWTEPHTLSFQGSMHRLDAGFLDWLNTLASTFILARNAGAKRIRAINGKAFRCHGFW